MDVVQAYGDSDDHLRLTVLLSAVLQAKGGDREAAEVCQSPKETWGTRLDALRKLVSEVGGQTTFPLLVDVDALYTGRLSPKVRWDDSQFRSDRAALLRLLVEAAGRCGWTFVRLAPSPAVTDMLEESGIQSNEASEEPIAITEDPFLNLVGTELRPILRWLLDSGHTDKKTAAEMIDATDEEEPSLDIVSMAFECLKPSVRRTAQMVSTLRPPQRLNGSFGRFRLSNAGTEDALPSEHVRLLKACGFLQQTPALPGGLQVPRTVRQLLSERFLFTEGNEVREVHKHLVQSYSANVIEDELEAHHHAVMSGSPTLATQTAKYYGNDLRHVAYSLSMEGRQRPEAYNEAAGVYRTIVRDFDKDDAYAWEYLGYNLARCAETELSEEIRRAYEKAVALAPNNPLYRGRLVAYLAKAGNDVREDFDRWMSYFCRTHGPVGARFFGFPVLTQLREGGHHDEVRRLKEEWPQLREESVRDGK